MKTEIIKTMNTMKKSCFYGIIAVLSLLMSATVAHATDLTVFNGNQVSPYVPLPTASYNQGGTRGQVIYPASALEEMVGQSINGFTMYVNAEGCKMNGGLLRVSMGEVEYTEFSGTTFATGLTVVAMTEMIAGVYEVDIVFDEPYVYNGGNLLIEFYVKNAGQSEAYNFTYFYGLFQTGHSSLTTGDEGNEYREFIPKTTFHYGEKDAVAAIVNPRALTFNEVRTGESDEQTLYLTNTGLNAFTPVVTVNAPFSVTVPQAPVQPGERVEIVATFAPTSAGLFEATMLIDCGNGVVVEVPMSGEALENGNELVVAAGGATNQYVPFNGIYADDVNTFGQMIYPASMLTDMKDGKLVALSFFTNNKINMRNVELELSLMNTDQEEFAQASSITGLTTVATASVIQGETVITFDFDQPFEYTGNNLAVQVKVKKAGWTSTTVFQGMNTENYASLSCYKSWSGDKKERQQFLPKAAFVYQEAPAFVRGDVDMDGVVGIADVTALVDYILNSDAQGIDLNAADCDQDGVIGIADVTGLVDFILSHTW